MAAQLPPPLRRHRIRRSVAAPGRLWLLAAGAAAILVLAGCGGSSSSAPVLPALHPGRVGPEAMLTTAAELIEDPPGIIAQLQALGVDQVHVPLYWNALAPDASSSRMPSFDAADPAAYSPAVWAPYDAIVRDLKAAGIAIDLAIVPPPPNWAEGPGAPEPSQHSWWKPSAPDFEQFVKAVATRYSGHYIPPGSSAPLPRVAFWSIWNEPDNGDFLAPQAIDHSTVEVSPRLYRGLVDAAWGALSATGHGHDTILIGELAPAGVIHGPGPGNFNSMPPLRFLRALYCVDSNYRPLTGEAAVLRGCPATASGSAHFVAANPGLFDATGYALHPYPQGLAPDQVTADEPDFAELGEIPKFERTLDRLQRAYGSATKFPIWSTEFGYQTTPPDTEEGTVSPTLAAAYLNWAEYLTWLDPRVKSYDQYLLTDPPAGNFATGLESATGVPKPGYFAFRMPLFLPVTRTAHGRPLDVWGCVRPAPGVARTTQRVQNVAIQFKPASGGRFRTVRTVAITDRYGYFEVRQTFPASGLVRLSWIPPHSAPDFSRTVSIRLN